jgi:parallel beta helix pectate lyase-like protein
MRALGWCIVVAAGCSLELPPPLDGGGPGTTCIQPADVHWPDALGYGKPPGVAMALPDEATCPNKWYVDFETGAGAACTEEAPCGSFEDVLGLPGTTGGPAYVYLRGAGGLIRLFELTLYGAAGSEVVVKPWPGSGLVTLAADDVDENLFTGDDIHHVVVDGGPDLEIEMVANQSMIDNVDALEIQGSDHLTFRRVRFRGAGSIANLVQAGAYGEVDDLRFINCEFADAPGVNGLVLGNVDSTATNVLVQGCVFRDIGSAAIWINPRVRVDAVAIDGNAFHDAGSGVLVTTDGGTVGDVTIRNNFFWAIADAAVSATTGTAHVLHDTVLDGTAFDLAPGAIVENNLLPSAAAGTFLSTDPASPDFLRLAPGSPAIDAGGDVGVAIDYFGACRPQGAGFDLGAVESP